MLMLLLTKMLAKAVREVEQLEGEAKQQRAERLPRVAGNPPAALHCSTEHSNTEIQKYIDTGCRSTSLHPSGVLIKSTKVQCTEGTLHFGRVHFLKELSAKPAWVTSHPAKSRLYLELRCGYLAKDPIKAEKTGGVGVKCLRSIYSLRSKRFSEQRK